MAVLFAIYKNARSVLLRAVRMLYIEYSRASMDMQ